MPKIDSPNHSARPQGVKPSLIVLHATGPGSLKGILEWVTTKVSKVSYHGLIASDGTYYQLVNPDRMAWHAGVSEWEGKPNCNHYSIGLSFVNPNDGKVPLTPQQIATAKGVIQYWRQKYGPLPVTTHGIIARPKGRKVDPDIVPNFRLADFAV